MTGERQIDRFVRANRDPSALPTDRFEWAGGRVRCVLCHAAGWGGIPQLTDSTDFAGRPVRWQHSMNRWQIAHLMDHPWTCSCGLAFREFVGLWRHIGADRPTGWGRQGEHQFALECAVAS